MDTFKYLVLIVTFAALVCVQNNPEAAPFDPCKNDDAINCTTPSEECDGTNCICSQDYYLSGNVCSPKVDYGGSCANTSDCKNGLTCVDDDSSNKKCLCNDNNYLGSGNTCVSTDALKPVIQETLTSTHDSVSLSWNSPTATGYSNNYIIKYTPQGGSQQTTSALGDVSQTTVNNLTPGTSYTFVVSRSITREGRTQSNIDSTERDSTTKADYGGSCANTADCKNGLTCVDDDSSNKKCLCNDNNFLGSGNTCVSTDALKPVIQGTLTSTHDSVSLSWNSPTAIGYNNNYIIKYTPQGGFQQTTSALGDVSQTTVNSLTPGTSYTFVVSRSITREGRTQSNIDSTGKDSTTNADYGGSCANTAECKNGLTCVDDDSSNKKCLCNDKSFLGSGNTCVSTDTLKPTIQATLTSTHDSVTLSWNSPTATGYTNKYIIKYTPQGGSQQTTSPLGDVSHTTVNGLTPGTSYTFVVSRSITREGRTQSNIDSTGRDSMTKLDYAATCTSTPPCRNGLSCEMVDDQSVRKCLCADGYYTGGICADKSGLKPVITDVTVSTDTARITWTSPTATGYTNSYIIKYSSTEGNRTHVVTGDASVTTVNGLTPAVQYAFVVSRSITREGRKQSDIDSIERTDSTDKIDYGQPCTQTGTCKDLNSNCYSDECRCDPGYFRNTDQCQNNDVLKPLNVQTQRLSTRQIRVTWTSPGYTGTGFNGYELDVTPSVSQEDISITDTTATLSSLTPGERYNITVKTKINYLNRDERAAADPVSEITKPATTTGISGAGNTTLNAPDIQIWFHSADGAAQGYSVRLQRGSPDVYDHTVYPTNTGTSIQALFNNVTAGRTYTLSIITNSYGVTSEPFTTTIRVMAQQAGKVNQLEAEATSITSRSVFVTWKRPKFPNGDIIQYSLQAIDNGKCVQQITINCTNCSRTGMIRNETSDTVCNNTVNIVISEEDIENDDYLVFHNVTGLLPDITYTIEVSAYNEEGKGVPDYLYPKTSTEAAGEPTGFNSSDQTSNSILLKWTPPVPRPGTTGYTIVVYEREEGSQKYKLFNTSNITGYDINSFNVTGLSSYWDYNFTIVAFTVVGSSQLVQLQPVKTKESEPENVVNLKHNGIENVYDKLQLSWECPKGKDRNGEIKSATVKLTTNTTSADVSPVQGPVEFANTNACTWNKTVTATPEFNYTFEVYVSNNGFNGKITSFRRYMPAGPAKVSKDSITSSPTGDSNHETIIPLELCPSCLLGGRNGRILSSGVTVCKHPCAQNRRRRALTIDGYDTMNNWNRAKANEFNGEYRATSNNWLAEVSDEKILVYDIGKDSSCEQNEGADFCNGPLPPGTKFVIVVFACTSVACDTSERITISTKETPINIGLIAGAVGGVVAAIIIIIIVVLVVRYMRRPQTTKLDPEEIEEELIVKKRPTRICNFEKKVEEMHKDSNLLFSEEFEDINALSPKHPCVASETGGNKLKNRYVNILPFDHSRVKLLPTEEDEEETDYINGNYIPGYRSQREYIATQGPMTGTVNDFWRMIWEQNVPIIVMLSDLSEKGKPKVDRYYPENMEPVQYGDIIVEMTNFSPLNKYVIRIFKLQLGDEIRMVRHYFLPGWQDFGANLTSDDVINFLKSVRMEIKPNNQGPLCIHCSAGVGRTGTYITLDVFQQYIDEEDMNKEMDIFDFTMKMRNNRSYMIQTEKQYIFVHDTIKEMIIRKKKEMSERDHIYQNHNTDDNNVYENQAFEADPQDIYMNVDSTGKPTTAL